MPRPLGEYDPTKPVTDLEKASWYTEAENASWYEGEVTAEPPKTGTVDLLFKSLIAELKDDGEKVDDSELSEMLKAGHKELEARKDAEILKDPANFAETHGDGAMDAHSVATLQGILATSILAALDQQRKAAPAKPMQIQDEEENSNDTAFDEDFGEWAKLMETQGDAMDAASAALVKEVLTAASDGDNLEGPAFTEDLKAWAKLIETAGDDAMDAESAALIQKILAKPTFPATGESAKPTAAMDQESAELASVLQAQEDEKLSAELATQALIEQLQAQDKAEDAANNLKYQNLIKRLNFAESEVVKSMSRQQEESAAAAAAGDSAFATSDLMNGLLKALGSGDSGAAARRVAKRAAEKQRLSSRR